LDRSEEFIDSGVLISDYGYDETLHAFDKGAGKVGVEAIDLLLRRKVLPREFDRTPSSVRRRWPSRPPTTSPGSRPGTSGSRCPWLRTAAMAQRCRTPPSRRRSTGRLTPR